MGFHSPRQFFPESAAVHITLFHSIQYVIYVAMFTSSSIYFVLYGHLCIFCDRVLCERALHLFFSSHSCVPFAIMNVMVYITLQFYCISAISTTYYFFESMYIYFLFTQFIVRTTLLLHITSTKQQQQHIYQMANRKEETCILR